MRSAAAWIMGVVSGLSILITSGFFIWLASNMLELKTSVSVMASTMTTQSTMNITRLSGIESSIDDLRSQQSAQRDRLTTIETLMKTRKADDR